MREGERSSKLCCTILISRNSLSPSSQACANVFVPFVPRDLLLPSTQVGNIVNILIIVLLHWLAYVQAAPKNLNADVFSALYPERICLL